MKKLILILALFSFSQLWSQSETFTKRNIISSGLSGPWEVVYGPNDSLWITESKGYKISRISLGSTPSLTPLLDLNSLKDFTGNPAPQGGLMGLAIHPNLYSASAAVRNAKPWVYVAYVYHRTSTSCPADATATACYFNTRVVRYDYNGTTLTNPKIILNNLPGSSDHNSGRLVISPVIEPGKTGEDAKHTQYRLYYTIGDMGAGQLSNLTRTNNAQVVNVLEGKVLRLNTEEDGDGGQDDWVPNDNPFYDASAITPQDYVFSYGHRNPQGLVWGSVAGNLRLYSSEQSDKADDEINIIQKSKNYGWDKVSGKCDGDVNGFKIGGRTIVDEKVTNCAGTTEPIFTMFHNNGNFPTTYPNNTDASTWPTIALSSIAFYGVNVIPGWNGSLLVTPLKEAQVYRIKLNADGSATTGVPIPYFTNIGGNRIRKITTAPDGIHFYVVRDGNNSITEYTYTGATLPLKLTFFKGSWENNATLLKWETAQEINTSFFDVERSLDGKEFTAIGKIKAQGNSNQPVDYSYTDNEAAIQPASVLYYRLKMVDADGSSTYSNVVSVLLSRPETKVTVLPNPVTGGELKVIVSAAVSGKAQWRLLDNSGRIVIQGSENLSIGNNQVLLNASKLAAGIYYLSISAAGLEQQVKIQKL